MNQTTNAFSELEHAVLAALETYSNVHRGSGHHSMVSTYLYEHARKIVLEYLGLSKVNYQVIFCSPRRATSLVAQLKPESYQLISGRDFGLPLGITAVAVKRRALPKGAPFQTGGGTARLVSPNWIIWHGAPDRFEAGTPAIINVIAFTRALQMIRLSGKDIFRNPTTENLTAGDILYHDELENLSGQELLDKLRLTLIGRGLCVPTSGGAIPYINLDNSASTPTFLPVWNTVCQTWHQPQPVQHEIVNEVRAICAKALGAPQSKYEVIFTANTTEAINLAAENLSINFPPDTQPVLLGSLLEHSSNDLPWRMVPGLSMIRLAIDVEGFVDLMDLETLLSDYNQKALFGKKRIVLVAVSGVSNVLGAFNNLAEISSIVHRHGARLLVDAAQLIAHRKVDMEAADIDYLAFSAHKVYAPFGSGALIVKKELLNFSQADMEIIRLSGEENTVGIAALGKALLLLQRIGMDLIREEEQTLTARVLRGLALINGLTVYGIQDPDSPAFAQKGGVIPFNLKDMMAHSVANELARQYGIGVRSGCHCAHLLVKHVLHVSPGLERFQRFMLTLIPKLSLPGMVRVSLGIENSEEDIDALVQALGKITNKTKTSGVKMQIDNYMKESAARVFFQK